MDTFKHKEKYSSNFSLVFHLCDQLIKLLKLDPMMINYIITYDIKENDQ